ESQELLLNEVNHRVKNNLYSLTGMLYKEKDKILKTKSKKDTIFIDDLISRIDGLAKVHNLLSASKWKPLNLSVLVNELTYNYFKNSLSEELNVNVKKHQKEMVNSYQAQHFALVYNEILTNIVKYCGINLDDLNINCKITSNKDYIFVRIRDNGVGFNKKILSGDYSEAGIGFDLIFGILKKSLAGSVEIENNNGAVYKLKFKKRI
ncbi:MAG: sensor histidine kinase, partial [Candidatus Cloacimonadota bacterium]|nr:sensor histidine kinase [Candidatus Cloacimonadota bacterium]